MVWSMLEERTNGLCGGGVGGLRSPCVVVVDDDVGAARLRACVQEEKEEGANRGLLTEAVEGASLPLERVHDVERRDGLAARVLGVRDRVADHVLQEHLEHAAGLL
eukprot:50017-Eustigmatos_ZCMA.PRE.1